MSVQYLSNQNGEVTAVQLSIDEWEAIKSKHPDIDHADQGLPRWHQELIDARLNDISLNPEKIRPISELLDALDRE